MPFCLLGDFARLLNPPQIHDEALDQAPWLTLGEGAYCTVAAKDHGRCAGFVRAHDDAVISSLLDIPSAGDGYVLALILRGRMYCGDVEFAPLDVAVFRPREQNELLLARGTLVLVAQPGERNRPQPGGPLTVDLCRFLEPLEPNAGACAALAPRDDGLPGHYALRTVEREIAATLCREPRTCQPYPMAFGEGGAVGLVLGQGRHFDGKSIQSGGCCYVAGPRDRIRSQNQTETWFFSVYLGELT